MHRLVQRRRHQQQQHQYVHQPRLGIHTNLRSQLPLVPNRLPHRARHQPRHRVPLRILLHLLVMHSDPLDIY